MNKFEKTTAGWSIAMHDSENDEEDDTADEENDIEDVNDDDDDDDLSEGEKCSFDRQSDSDESGSDDNEAEGRGQDTEKNGQATAVNEPVNTPMNISKTTRKVYARKTWSTPVVVVEGRHFPDNKMTAKKEAYTYRYGYCEPKFNHTTITPGYQCLLFCAVLQMYF
jgi:hypothetical protein